MRSPHERKRGPGKGPCDLLGGDREAPYLIRPRAASEPLEPTLETLAHRAFEEHVSLGRMELGSPELRQSPFWQILRRAAFARFARAFEALDGCEP